MSEEENMPSENDPDILQSLDESDSEWVGLWKKSIYKDRDELVQV